MCGRYILQLNSFDIVNETGVDPRSEFEAMVNIAPGFSVPLVLADGGKLALDRVKWGYEPGWGSGPKFLINLRSETIAEKKFASKALKEGRCIFPATGFFEWKTRPSIGKTPVLFELPSTKLFGIAGLRFQPKEGECSCVILTTSPNDTVAVAHDRMPVVVAKEDWKNWIDGADYQSALTRFAKPFVAQAMEGWYVSKEFNRAGYKGELVREERCE